MHNHLTHSDDFINAGFKVTKTLWRSTPNGLETKRTLSALLQRLNQGRFPRITGHFGRRGKNTQLPPAGLLRTPPTAASRAMRMSTMPREPRKIRRSG